MKPKILVCGATGFIGRNLIERLATRDDLDVYGTHFKTNPPKIKNVRFIYTDLQNAQQVSQLIANKDIIIQAAATTSGSKNILSRPYYHVTDNAVMNSLILRAAYEHHVSQLIFLSCSVMYQPRENPVKETDFNLADEIYPDYFGVGWTKVYIEKMCEFYARLGRTKHTVIRHSNIYGPHDKFDLERSHVFGALITKVLTADDYITLWGQGTEKRDLLYVEDLVDFIESAIKKQTTQHELVNVGSGKCVSIHDLAKKIIHESKKQLAIKFDTTKPTINTKLCLDITKAYAKFGWQPHTKLEDGIKKILAWYKIHLKDTIYA